MGTTQRWTRGATWLAALLAVAVPGAAAVAETLPAPPDAIVLTVTGNIATANSGEAAIFDMAMLKALPAASFETATIWTEGRHSFTGVSLAKLLDTVGAEGTMLAATAINDYSVAIPVSDAVDGGPIVAYMMDGSDMPVRRKGPLWLVYPYDDEPGYRTEVIYSRSIWQLDRIVVHD